MEQEEDVAVREDQPAGQQAQEPSASATSRTSMSSSAYNLITFNPFAGMVRSLWSSGAAPVPPPSPAPSDQQPLGTKEPSSEELITVDLESIPTAVVFGKARRKRSASSIQRDRELQQLKEELDLCSAKACGTEIREDGLHLRSDDDDEAESEVELVMAQEQQSSWMTTAKSWIPTLNVQAALSSMGSTIKYSIISPQTEETFGKIAALCSQFFADVSVSYSELIVGLMLLSSTFCAILQLYTAILAYIRKVYQRKLRENIRTDIPVTRAALEDAYYYMRFAAAVYGWQLIYGYNFEGKANGFFKGLISGESINPQIVAAKTGISEEDLITTQWESKDFNPGHYMAYDHSRKSIVIAIRGTFHLRDALTDLVASYEPFEDGAAHCGMLYTSQKKLELLEPFLLEARSLYPEYSLVIVGHSLGAGVASLLTILLHTKYPDLKISCHAYATPCVVSLDLAKKYRHLITSYVMGDDLVPRLSYGSMEELKGHILIILSQEKSTMGRLFQIIAAGNTLGKSTTKKLENLLKCNASMDIDELQRRRRELILPEKLWPPGIVYHMYRLPKKTWSEEDRERDRRQNREEQERRLQTPEEAIKTMIRENERMQESHNRRQHSGERESIAQHRSLDGQSGTQKGAEGTVDSDTEHKKWSDEDGQGMEKKDEVPPRGSETARAKVARHRFAIEESAPSLFSEIVVSSRMFSDHFPDVYEAVLRALLEQLNDDEESEADDATSLGVMQESSEEIEIKKEEVEREYDEGVDILRNQAIDEQQRQEHEQNASSSRIQPETL